MQSIDNKLYITNARRLAQPRPGASSLATRIAHSTASQRLSVLVIGGFLLAGCPALVSTVAGVVSLSLAVLFECGHIGLVAFQLFGR
jgi:hypothetical protein